MFKRKKPQESHKIIETNKKYHFKFFQNIYYAFDTEKDAWIVSERPNTLGRWNVYISKKWRIDQAIEDFKR